MQDHEHRADGARHHVEVEPHRVRREPAEHLDAAKDRIDRRDHHQARADQAAVDRQARTRVIVDALEDAGGVEAGVVGQRLEPRELIRHLRRLEPEQHLAERDEEHEQADHPHHERRVATALGLREPTRADIEALGERQDRQDFLAILLLQVVVEAGAAEHRHRRRALAKQVVRVDLDQRARRACRHARLIAVRDAVIALVRDPTRARDAAGSRAELERVLLLEPVLEVELEHRRVGLDLDHIDRAVRTRLRARGAAGARRLVDHDFLALGVELDRVVRARIDAAADRYTCGTCR